MLRRTKIYKISYKGNDGVFLVDPGNCEGGTNPASAFILPARDSSFCKPGRVAVPTAGKLRRATKPRRKLLSVEHR